VKKRVTAMLLIFAMVFTFLPIVPAQAYGSDSLVIFRDGNPVETVVLPQNEKAKLTAVRTQTGSAEYQWQILAGGVLWVDIEGEDDVNLHLSYAMVASVLIDGSVKIRCKTMSDEAGDYNTEVKVSIDYEVESDTNAEIIPAESGISYRNVLSATNVDDETEVNEAFQADALADEEVRIPEKSSSRLVNSIVEENETTESLDTHSIIINYVFQNGEQAANSWTATLATGSGFSKVVASPAVIGYAPDQESVSLDFTNISEDKTVTVTYAPELVDYTVIHYRQNQNDDLYTVFEEEMKTGYTESQVGEGLESIYEGFFSLLYDKTTTIAADGSTIIEIYYDRYYFLMRFNLDGGYGVEPIYARYESPISIGTPIKAGYTFTGWNQTLPSTMPVGGGSYKANWTSDVVTFDVIFWYENADDDGYSEAGVIEDRTAQAGSIVDGSIYRNLGFEGRDNTHFTYSHADENVMIKGDGSSAINVYFSRNLYTLTFQWRKNSNKPYDKLNITQKYDSEITAVWESDPIKSFLDDGYIFQSNITDNYYTFLERMPGQNITMTRSSFDGNTLYTWYYYLEVLPGQNTSGLTIIINNNKTYFLYHTSSVIGGTGITLTYAEDYFPITGFNQRDSVVPSFNSSRRAYLYYTRNSYDLTFSNNGATVDGEGGTYLFDANISNTNFVPDYPAEVEPGAYLFEGWYESPFFGDTRFDFTTSSEMPANNLTLYARWVPKEHEVEIYLTSELNENEKIGETQSILHGTTAAQPDEPTNGQYTFVGWFYKVGNVEKAFDFSMPVNKDLTLYAKWSSNVLMNYTIRYETFDGTPVAQEITGSTLAGTTKTFEAKAGDALYAGYQTGYFPETSSHSITIDIEDQSKNEYTFIYVPKESVSYTVRYLEFETGDALLDEKTVETSSAVITETFEAISGYMPDAYQKRLVLSSEESQNVITFWYARDEIHAPVQIIHYIQNTVGEDYTEYQTITDLNGIIGNLYSVDVLTISGYDFHNATINGENVVATNEIATGTVAASGLILELYYDRILYPYEFRFLLQGTNEALADPIVGTARYGAQITQNAKSIPGYIVQNGPFAMTIRIEEGTSAVNNERTFYYIEKEAAITYEAIGPQGETNFGSLSKVGEILKVITGDALGSSPIAEDGYRFIGWYYDEECTQAVTETGWLLGDAIDPQKTKDYDPSENQKLGFEEATYYARFDYKPTDLTIHKTGAEVIDENQSFIFHIVGDSTDKRTSRINLKVVISIGEGEILGSKTIKNLPVGKYTVSEEGGWSWRYTADAFSKEITLHHTETNSVNFSNQRTVWKWLNGASYNHNSFNNQGN